MFSVEYMLILVELQSHKETIAFEARHNITLHTTVVAGRHFWLFVFAGGPPYKLYTYIIYHVYTLCIYTTIYIFGRLPAMSKGRPPTTMLHTLESVQEYQ